MQVGLSCNTDHYFGFVMGQSACMRLTHSLYV
jgi:hypothetical protein